MLGVSSLDCEILFYEVFTKPVVKRIRIKLEKASKEQLEEIIQARNSLPWYKKLDKQVCFYASRNFEINLEYIWARDLLNGTFSWEQADEEQRKKEQEREKVVQKAKQKEELMRKGQSIDLFIGSLEEYERLKSQEYEIINVKGLVFYHPCDNRIHLFLGELGVEALIRFKPNLYNNCGIGIPIRKKS